MLQNISFDWSEFCARASTDKKFKLHIVTEFKVIINSLSPFGFRYLGGGTGLFMKKNYVVWLNRQASKLWWYYLLVIICSKVTIFINPLRTEPFPEIVKFSTKKTSLPKKRGRFDEVKTCPIGARRVVSYSKLNVDYDAHVHLSLNPRESG